MFALVFTKDLQVIITDHKISKLSFFCRVQSLSPNWNCRASRQRRKAEKLPHFRACVLVCESVRVACLCVLVAGATWTCVSCAGPKNQHNCLFESLSKLDSPSFTSPDVASLDSICFRVVVCCKKPVFPPRRTGVLVQGVTLGPTRFATTIRRVRSPRNATSLPARWAHKWWMNHLSVACILRELPKIDSGRHTEKDGDLNWFWGVLKNKRFCNPIQDKMYLFNRETYCLTNSHVPTYVLWIIFKNSI